MLRLSKNLTPLREAAKLDIDAQAEAVRGRFITLGAGQSMVYDQKRDEAELFMKDQSVPQGEIPHLVAEAAKNGVTVFDQAVIYLTMRQQWLTISPIIEDRRLRAKDAVDEAQAPAAIEAARLIDWSDIAA